MKLKRKLFSCCDFSRVRNLSEGTDRSGMCKPSPLSVWYGQEDIATVINEAGQIDDDDPELGGVEYMFDQNPNTCCHSDLAFEKEPKTIRIEFQVGCIFSFKNCTDYY